MAKPLRPKRGTTAQNNSFTGLPYEITIDKDKHSIRVHDGVTPGGHEILPDCLPKSGGELSGYVKTSSWISKTTNDSNLGLYGGNGWRQGAHIELFGPNSNSGKAIITGNNGTKSCALTVSPDGWATLGEKRILTSAGGDIEGALRITSAISDMVDDSYVGIYGGSGYRKGAYLELDGPSSNAPGIVGLVAYDGQTRGSLLIKPDGTFTFNNKAICTVDTDNPVGTVIAIASNSAPTGYLLCNGAAVSRTTYAKLFAAIGALYGAGDGTSTFNLPDLQGRFVQGSGTAGSYVSAGLPNIEGNLALTDWQYSYGNDSYATGALSRGRADGQSGRYISSGTSLNENRPAAIVLNASKSNAIYGASDTVQPKALKLRYYIKY